ncbi:uncharacterized protein LOC129976596 [Argiope bruennichi]|uniref:uncharacterized protein LOC129976596 n=1 Tax=Argiope bruennichi TaxID=94029 RepID=UPI0024940CCA|nr:uncharacterized protein LOC129976596 [Argiope bruennichi]
MFAKIALLLAALAAVDATVLAPGLLNAGIVGPAAVSTSSVVAIPGAVTTDKRVIGTTGLIGAPLLSSGIIGNGLLANGLIGAPVLNSGLIGAPVLNNGLIGAQFSTAVLSQVPPFSMPASSPPSV